MFKSRFVRVLASGALAGAGVVALTVPNAGAATPGIACKVMKGNISSTVTLKKCTGNTGGASKPLPAAALATGGTVTWKNGKTTTVKLTVTQGPGTKCAPGSTEYDAKGKVTKDTTKSTAKGHKVAAKVCVSSAGAITLLPGTKATFA
jgi:hypothetical protein